MKTYATQAHAALRDALACMAVDSPADPKVYIAAYLLARSGALLSQHAEQLLATHLPHPTLAAVLASRRAAFDAHSRTEHDAARAAVAPSVGAASNAPLAILANGGDALSLEDQLYISHGPANALVPVREVPTTGQDKLSFVDMHIYQKINP